MLSCFALGEGRNYIAFPKSPCLAGRIDSPAGGNFCFFNVILAETDCFIGMLMRA